MKVLFFFLIFFFKRKNQNVNNNYLSIKKYQNNLSFRLFIA